MPSQYSHLFVPATTAGAFLKKLKTAPGSLMLPYAVVFDLEDSIGEDCKESARGLLRSAITEHFDECGRLFRWYVRINGCSSPFSSQDLEFLRSFGKCQVGVKLPKCRNRDDIIAVEEFHCASAPMIPTIETPEGYENRHTIIEYAKKIGVKNIGFGAGDMAMELGIERDYKLPILRHLICELIIATKCHGLNLVDSPSRVLPAEGRDWQSLVAEEAAFSCGNGFAGKVAIHPSQVPIIERVFSAEEKVARARRVLGDFDIQNPTRAIRSSENGDYAGTPSMKHAKRILQTHEMPEDATSAEPAASLPADQKSTQ